MMPDKQKCKRFVEMTALWVACMRLFIDHVTCGTHWKATNAVEIYFACLYIENNVCIIDVLVTPFVN